MAKRWSANSKNRHIILAKHEATAVSFWTMHTHALEYAEHSPRLNILSPAKRCGKTTLLNTVSAIVYRPLHTESITIASLFRVVEKFHPTLLIDEVDSFLKDNEEMRGLLNAGHGRFGQVIRTVGEDFEPRRFSVWGAVALTGIGRLAENNWIAPSPSPCAVA